MKLLDADGNGLLAFKEEGGIRLLVANRGGLVARDVRVVLSTEEPLLEVLQAEARFGDLAVGKSSMTPVDDGEFPRLRLEADFSGERQLSVRLDVYENGVLVGGRDFQIHAASSVLLSGRVVDEAGNGLEGIEFAVFCFPFSKTLSFSIRSGEDGAFQQEVPPGQCLFYREEEENLARSISLRVLGDTYLEAVMDEVHPVTGTIRDPEGNPLSRIRLWAEWPRGNTRMTTGEDGGYSLMLPRGLHTIEATDNASGREQNFPRQEFEVGVGGETHFDMVLKRGVRVAVEVVDEEGVGVGDLLVRASGHAGASARTGGEGIAVMELLPEVYKFQPYNPPAPYLGNSLPYRMVAADTTVRIELQLRRGFTITGSVRDESVEPSFDALLYFLSLDSGGYFQTLVGEDGAYEVLLPGGRYQPVFFPYERGKSLLQSFATILVAGDDVFDFVAKGGILIDGKLLDEEGGGLADVFISGHSAQFYARSRARTRDDGSFEIYLKPGQYEFFGFEDYGLSEDNGFWHFGDAEVFPSGMFELRTSFPASLRGRVVDAMGGGVGNALVALGRGEVTEALDNAFMAGNGGTGSAGGIFADEDGKFELRGCPGTYIVAILPYWGSGVGIVRRGVELSGDEERELVLPAVGTAHSVYGEIECEPDFPWSGIRLQLYDQATGIVVRGSALAGSYLLEVPPGHYRVRVGLTHRVRGMYKIYEMGAMRVEGDMRWDIRLTGEDTTVAGEVDGALPGQVTLAQNFPNPFNGGTTISFDLPRPGTVALTVFNILGQPVRKLVQVQMEAGHHKVVWDGRNDRGRSLGSGVFFYRLVGDGQVQIRRLLLLK